VVVILDLPSGGANSVRNQRQAEKLKCQHSSYHDAEPHLPRKHHDNDNDENSRDLLLRFLPRAEATLGAASLSLAGVVAGERPSHIVQTVEATAVESILDATNGMSIPSLEQTLPPTFKPTAKPTDRDKVGSGKGGEDGLQHTEGEDQPT
jgi:hypothetical protein